MEETFLININCSKILADNDETQYTMCIDSTKMSIVYELAEWIRWIFSLDTCFYITHNNSVIHELEDIQLLSKLRSLEIKPCGRSHCVHKKMYRTLLKNLNLFAPWNGIEVHKYFLHKLYKVDQKLTYENSKVNPTLCVSRNKDHQDLMVFKNTRTDNTNNIGSESSKLFLSDNKLPKALKDNTDFNKILTGTEESETNAESLNKANSSPDKKILNENFLISSEYKLNYLNDSNSEVTENLTVETGTFINNAPVNTIKKKLNAVQEQNKSCQKSYTKKYVKPFSLGEILSNIREDFEKQNTEMKLQKASPSPNSLVMKEENFDEEVTSGKNSFITEIKINEGRKRQRTRKRKKSKKGNLEKEEITSPYLDANVTAYSLGSFTSTHVKPNHIRFDTEDEEMEIVSVQDEWNKQSGNKFEITSNETNNLTEIEYDDEQNAQIKNKFEFTNKPINNSTPSKFLKPNPDKCSTLKMGSNQDLAELYQASPLINSAENNMEFSSAVNSQISSEEKLIDLDISESANQPSYGVENSELKSSNPHLNSLLSLKEKFKNVVVIERFY